MKKAILRQGSIFFALLLLNKSHKRMKRASPSKTLYKSHHSPYYSSYSPILQRLIEIKLAKIQIKRERSPSKADLLQINKKQKVLDLKRLDNLVVGSTKKLIPRCLTARSSAQELRSLTKLNQRPRSSITIIRTQSLPKKAFRTGEELEKQQQNQEMLMLSAGKLAWQRRQV